MGEASPAMAKRARQGEGNEEPHTEAEEHKQAKTAPAPQQASGSMPPPPPHCVTGKGGEGGGGIKRRLQAEGGQVSGRGMPAASPPEVPRGWPMARGLFSLGITRGWGAAGRKGAGKRVNDPESTGRPWRGPRESQLWTPEPLVTVFPSQGVH